MMSIIRQVRAEDNPKLAYRILVTLLDQRNRTHRDIRDQLERTFGIGLFKTVIEIDTKLRESPILGLSITQYKPNSRGALQYRSLAEELIQYVEQANSEAA
jgi:chromosome partitioning protein